MNLIKYFWDLIFWTSFSIFPRGFFQNFLTMGKFEILAWNRPQHKLVSFSFIKFSQNTKTHHFVVTILCQINSCHILMKKSCGSNLGNNWCTCISNWLNERVCKLSVTFICTNKVFKTKTQGLVTETKRSNFSRKTRLILLLFIISTLRVKTI